MSEPINCRRRCLFALTLVVLGANCVAQELEPRAYSISPKGVNFGVVAFARSAGDVSFDPSLPVENGNATLHATFLAYGRSLSVLGRSANVGITCPYIWGDLRGKVSGVPQEASRSGLSDAAVRFAINLYGAPAMDAEQFGRYRQKTNIGASVVLITPMGQYDPARFVNISSNRWATKPEIGVSHRFGRWFVDLYLGAWLFTPNKNYQGRVRRQDPITSSQLHVSYNFARRLWAAFDANFYTGGRTSVEGVPGADLQRNSRLGATVSIPVTRRQSIKFSGSAGAITSIGANFISLGVAYQYLWGGGL